MNFSEALEAVKTGSKIQREGWNGKGMYVKHLGADDSTNMLPYLVMRTVQGTFVPWLASQTDILADDWTILLASKSKLPVMSRGREWEIFQEKVRDHIADYTIPQYGDAPNDPITEFTPEHIGKEIKRYCDRIGTNARGGEEAKRDMLKIAHYACVAYHKLEVPR